MKGKLCGRRKKLQKMKLLLSPFWQNMEGLQSKDFSISLKEITGLIGHICSTAVRSQPGTIRSGEQKLLSSTYVQEEKREWIIVSLNLTSATCKALEHIWKWRIGSGGWDKNGISFCFEEVIAYLCEDKGFPQTKVMRKTWLLGLQRNILYVSLT